MTTGTEIELRAQSASQASLPAKVHYAKALADSGLLPSAYRKQPANVLYAIEYGDMLGLSPMAAITGVHIIEGKPSASAGLISALVRRAGHKLRVSGDGKSATCQIIRADDPDFTFAVTWTLQRNEDGHPSAAEAGLLNKNTWKSYPAAMLKSRAITQCARDACEEALFGLHYTPEELGAEVDEDGAVVAQIMDEPPAPEVEDPWLNAALEKAPELTDLDACGALWRKSVERVKAGELTQAQAARLQDLLRPRIEHLKAAEAAQPAEPEAEPAALDPEDSWMPAIEGIGSTADADVLLDDLADQLGRGEIDADRASRIEAAIVTRLPKAGREAEAA